MISNIRTLVVAAGALSPSRALSVARQIHENNPHHITEAILARFTARLSELNEDP